VNANNVNQVNGQLVLLVVQGAPLVDSPINLGRCHVLSVEMVHINHPRDKKAVLNVQLVQTPLYLSPHVVYCCHVIRYSVLGLLIG
jgi:hypothetical protein